MADKKINEDVIELLGEKIERSVMPRVYEMAKVNPDNLVQAIEGMMKAQKFTNAGSAMAQLESDLEGL